MAPQKSNFESAKMAGYFVFIWHENCSIANTVPNYLFLFWHESCNSKCCAVGQKKRFLLFGTENYSEKFLNWGLHLADDMVE